MTGEGPLDEASAPRVAALGVRFLLELALLTGVAVVVWSLVPDGWRSVAAFLAVVVVAAVWGLFLSPKATTALPAAVALVIESVLFAGTGVGLVAAGFWVTAVIGIVVWVADHIALAVLQ